MDKQKPLNSALIMMGTIVGICLVLSTIIAASTFYRVRSFDNALSVTGSAKKPVRSDVVKWTGEWSRIVNASDLRRGYARIDQDTAAVKRFLAENGIPEKEIDISPVSMYQNYDYREKGNAGERDYNLRQTVQIQSGDVDKITAIAKNIQSLVNQGVIFSSVALEYSYSKLPELRVELLSEAVKDAKARAAKLAESSGKQIGVLKSASMGVVQVLPVNSVEVNDYGAYDTSKIDKDVMVTVKAVFTIK